MTARVYNTLGDRHGECVLMIVCRLHVYSSEYNDDDMTDYFAPCTMHVLGMITRSD